MCPDRLQEAVKDGAPIRFSSAAEDAKANRQPDFFFSPEGKLIANPHAKPSPDGSINIEIQSKDPNASLQDAISQETDLQKQFGQGLMQFFEQLHPGQSAPAWMKDLASAKPTISDFAPFEGSAGGAAPENGFVNRGVSNGATGRSGDGGFGGFANNGGFDGQGNFRGNGGSGDGSIPTGASSAAGKPLGPGEQVQAKQLYDYMTQHYGLTPVQASGILGNIQTESSFRTNAYNEGEGAIGFAQWEGGRRTALENFANQHNKPVTDWQVQVDYLMSELHGPENQAWQAIQSSSTPAQAARAFDMYYERSSGSSREERAANANNIFKQVKS
jgi:hypothetical protein